MSEPARPRSIVFLLPGSGHVPVGGFRVAYEYAQGLAARGHDVSVVHASWIGDGTSPLRRVRAFAGFLRRAVTGFRPDRWFPFRTPVRMLWQPSLDERRVPRADVYVATAWQTAEWLGRAALPWARGRLYLIQHDEVWAGPAERVHATWKLPLQKIVIARWLQDLASEMGEASILIPNGLDLERFGVDRPREEREPGAIAMLVHPARWKGTEVGLEALARARAVEPTIHGLLFGTGARPAGLPDGCEYHRDPSPAELRALYNRASIILSPSFAEGWSLIGPEGMLCGAAFVATDIGGHRYTDRTDTAVLVPPGDPAALAEALVRVVRDPELRYRLARAGEESIREFTWARAVDRFESVVAGSSPD